MSLIRKADAVRSGLRFEDEVSIPRVLLQIEKLNLDETTFVGSKKECNQVRKLINAIKANVYLLNRHLEG